MRPSWVNAAASPGRAEAPALERRPHHEGERVVGEEGVEVGPLDAGLLEEPVLPRPGPPEAVVLLGDAEAGPGPDELVAAGGQRQHRRQLDGRLAQVAGPFERGDQHAGRAVVDQAVVVEAQRLAHVAGALVVLDGERVPHDGGRVGHRPLAERDRHRRQLLGGGAEAVEVALGRQRRAGTGRGHADDGVLTVTAAALAGALVVAVAADGRAPGPLDPARPGDAREGDAGEAGDDVGHAAAHRHRRVLHAGGGEAAVAPGLGVEAQVQAEREGERVGVRAAGRAEADQHAVQLTGAQAGVVEGGRRARPPPGRWTSGPAAGRRRTGRPRRPPPRRRAHPMPSSTCFLASRSPNRRAP